MERLALEAKLRSVNVTKGELNQLRSQDLVPAVVYGRGKENTPVIIEGRPLRQVLTSGAGSNAIVELRIDNEEKKNATETVMFKDVQRDILYSDRLLHVDFIRISLTEKILVNIPVNIVGDSPGVKEGGVMQIQLRELEVNCLPTAIPDFIEVDISSLNIGDSLAAKELNLAGDIELQTDPEEIIVHITVATQIEEEEALEDGAEADETSEEASEETEATEETAE